MHGQFLARICSLAITSPLIAAAPPQPVRVPVSALAVDEAGVVALTADDVRVLDLVGFPTARLARAGAGPGVMRRRSPRASEAGDRFAAAAGVRADGDFNDPYDPDSEIEDPENILVEDEAPARRHRAPAGVRDSGVALAAGGPFAWVGREDGLWRLPFRGGPALRVALPAAGAVRTVAAGADGRVVVAATTSGLAWSDDGGERFETIPTTFGPAPRLAVTAAGRTFALDRGGLRLIGNGPGQPRLIAVPEAEDLVSCGDAALVLARHRVFVLAAGSEAAEEGPAVPWDARRLGCAPDGSLWIAYGPSLWTSVDRGQTWTARDEVPALFVVEAAAASRSALWIAGKAGLAVLPRTARGSVAAIVRPAPHALEPDGGPLPRWHWWMGALPRVDIGFSTAQSNTRHDVRAFLLLSLSFDGRRVVRTARQIEADESERARRDAACRMLARQDVADQTPDGLSDEEREATLRVLGE